MFWLKSMTHKCWYGTYVTNRTDRQPKQPFRCLFLKIKCMIKASIGSNRCENTFSSVRRKTPAWCCSPQGTTWSRWAPDIRKFPRPPPLNISPPRHELLSGHRPLSSSTADLPLPAFQTDALFNNILCTRFIAAGTKYIRKNLAFGMDSLSS